jgi:hypothetical protein
VLWAWARQRERIACIENTASLTELRIFDWDAAGSLGSFVVPGDYAFPADTAASSRRVLSPSGRWLAFATEEYLYVADLGGAEPRIIRQDPWIWTDRTPVELGFSADERFVLEHRGTMLLLHSLEYPEYPAIGASGTSSLNAPAECQPSFVDGPSTWCGNPHNGHEFVWSPESPVAAFRTDLGTLQLLDFSLLDLSQSPSTFRKLPVNDQCGGTCMGQFDFQP